MGASVKYIIGAHDLIIDALASRSLLRVTFLVCATCLLFVRLTITCHPFLFFQLDEGSNIWVIDKWAKVRE